MSAGLEEDVLERAQLIALAVDMSVHGRDRDAPVRSVMGLLGDRWSTLILLVLASGAIRHAALRRVLSALSSEGVVSQRVMTLKLRALQRDGFVDRMASADIPPRVSYALTPLGHDLAAHARAMIDWINRNETSICTARSIFDRAEGCDG